jgi:acylphosphatase
VKNLADGRVEVVATGAPAAIASLASWLWDGPPAAKVEAVQLEEWLAPVAKGFVTVR